MRVYFVRHGQSKLNAQGVHQHGYVELSESGVKQAKYIAKRFASIPIEVILASNYTRAKQTAETIHKATKTPLVFTSLIQEIKRPTEIEGKTYQSEESKAVRKQMYEHRNDPEWHYSDEENYFDFRKRVEEFISYLCKRKERNILVVSHGYVMKMVFGLLIFGHDALNVDIWNSLHDSLRLSNTGITVFDRDEKGEWHLVTWNDYAHLGEATSL